MASKKEIKKMAMSADQALQRIHPSFPPAGGGSIPGK